MGKKNNKKKKAVQTESIEEPPESAASTGSSGGMTRVIAMAMVVVGVAVIGYALVTGPESQDAYTEVRTAPSASTAANAKPAPYFDSVEEAKPFPVTLPPSHFENVVLQQSYQVAKDIPEVLAQQPCLCGCDQTNESHGSLLDCFIDEHAST